MSTISIIGAEIGRLLRYRSALSCYRKRRRSNGNKLRIWGSGVRIPPSAPTLRGPFRIKVYFPSRCQEIASTGYPRGSNMDTSANIPIQELASAASHAARG
jgi:hypothetical protein